MSSASCLHYTTRGLPCHRTRLKAARIGSFTSKTLAHPQLGTVSDRIYDGNSNCYRVDWLEGDLIRAACGCGCHGITAWDNIAIVCRVQSSTTLVEFRKN